MPRVNDSLAQITVEIVALERRTAALKRDRESRIADMRGAGQTLAQIAKIANLSRQRVFQICKDLK
jgi:DNA-binding CsgD family transcriptional regulator